MRYVDVVANIDQNEIVTSKIEVGFSQDFHRIDHLLTVTLRGHGTMGLF